MINLRKDVERVVRPIRASTWRKNQMREELLAHLEELLAEEKARRGDDVGAVRRARARFGEPGQLTTELQATVPRWERRAFVPVPGLQRGRRGPGEALGAYQRRSILRRFSPLAAEINQILTDLSEFNREIITQPDAFTGRG